MKHIDQSLVDDMVNNILDKSVGQVWKDIEDFPQASLRTYYRRHYFEALNQIGTEEVDA